MRSVQRSSILATSAFLCLLVPSVGFMLPKAPRNLGILEDILDMADQAENRVTAARDRALEARNSINTVRTNALQGIVQVTGTIRDVIAEAAQDARTAIEGEVAGMVAFTGDGGCSLAECEPFRDDLISMLTGFQDALNGFYTIIGSTDQPVDLQNEILLVQGLPGRALFPLWRVLTQDSSILDGDMLQDFAELGTQLGVLAMLSAEPSEFPGATFTLDFERNVACAFALENPWLVRAATSWLRLGGARAKVRAAVLGAIASKSTPKMGVHGYPGLALKLSITIKISKLFEQYSDLLFWLAKYTTDSVEHCFEIGALGELADTQEELTAAMTSVMSALDGVSENHEQMMRLIEKIAAGVSNSRLQPGG